MFSVLMSCLDGVQLLLLLCCGRPRLILHGCPLSLPLDLPVHVAHQLRQQGMQLDSVPIPARVTPGLGETAMCKPGSQRTGYLCEKDTHVERTCAGSVSDLGTPQPVLLRKLLVGFQQGVKLQVVFVQLVFTSTCTNFKLSSIGAKVGP